MLERDEKGGVEDLPQLRGISVNEKFIVPLLATMSRVPSPHAQLGRSS
jgi:hypothetical protein